jgi:hypothetical protein
MENILPPKETLEALLKRAGKYTSTDVSDLDVSIRSISDPGFENAYEREVASHIAEERFSYSKGDDPHKRALEGVESFRKHGTSAIVCENDQVVWASEKSFRYFAQILKEQVIIHELTHIIDLNKHLQLVDKDILKSKEGLERFMTLVESHGDYVKMKYDAEEMPYFMLEDSIRNQKCGAEAKFILPRYADGLDLIHAAYKKGLHISSLFKELPTFEEFKSPEKYFARVKHDKLPQ